MSARSEIVNALVEKLKAVNGEAPYKGNFNGNVTNKLKFWDEVNDFPYVCVSSGFESREYLPGEFKWGYLTVNIKVYVQKEEPLEDLEAALHDIELVVDANRTLQYNDNGDQTTEILLNSIATDEGLLAPIGVGDINLQVRYQVV